MSDNTEGNVSEITPMTGQRKLLMDRTRWLANVIRSLSDHEVISTTEARLSDHDFQIVDRANAASSIWRGWSPRRGAPPNFVTLDRRRGPAQIMWEFDRYGSINVAIEHSERRDRCSSDRSTNASDWRRMVQSGGLDPSSP